MLEVNNNFLLVGLIIVAVTCIYLLYLNLSKASELASLKSALTSLIQQNKKRDEINNFLLERVDTLTAVINGQNSLQAPPVNVVTGSPVTMVSNSQQQPIQEQTMHVEVEDFDSAEIDEILAEDNLTEASNMVHSNSESKVPESEPAVPEVTESPTSVTQPVPESPTSVPEPVPEVPEPVPEVPESVPEVPESVPEVPEPVPEVPVSVASDSLSELINTSEFGDDVSFLFMAKNATAKQKAVDLAVVNSGADLIDGLLENDLSVNGDLVSELGELDPTIDYTAVPKDKKKLTSGYTAKQLKSIARHFGVKSRGTKTELVNRIFEKMQ